MVDEIKSQLLQARGFLSNPISRIEGYVRSVPKTGIDTLSRLFDGPIPGSSARFKIR